MAAALDAWDRAILAFEARVRQGARPANIHIALGVVYLDRYRWTRRCASSARPSDSSRAGPTPTRFRRWSTRSRTSQPRPRRRSRRRRRSTPDDRRSSTACPANSRWPAGTPRRPLRCARSLPPENPAGRPVGRRSRQCPLPAGGAASAGARRRANLSAGTLCRAFRAPGARDYTAAVALFRQAIQRDPIIGDALGRERLGQGSAALRAGNVRSAIEHLQAAVSAEPDRAEAHRLLAVALREADQHEGSIEAFRAAIRLNPGDERSRIALAVSTAPPAATRKPSARCKRRSRPTRAPARLTTASAGSIV